MIDPKYKCSTVNWQPSVCYLRCGDLVRDSDQECDNGNQTGCTNCKVDTGYTCYADIGYLSRCDYPVVFVLPSMCGNSILNLQEACDNGNRAGCSANCVPDPGYQCIDNIGSTSICTLTVVPPTTPNKTSSCGNGVVNGNQQCDNGNQIGCSHNCMVDPGYVCVGQFSVCTKKNPACGNGVIEIGEDCDDENMVNLDGCSSACITESGYNYTGNLGQISVCKKIIVFAICGNGVFQPNIQVLYTQANGIIQMSTQSQSPYEQCDNGNQLGCRGCLIQVGWTCISNVNQLSVCSPQITVPPCGNGLLEPLLGQTCDDSNVVNGDGCDQSCKVEFGWICPLISKCLTVQQYQANLIALYCADGRVQTQFGQSCDDTNRINGDGCSDQYKIETGWSCLVNLGQTRSRCSQFSSQTFAFCGNGVVEGSEECDDGFPLLNGDGCSISCKIEPGWNCYQTICWRI